MAFTNSNVSIETRFQLNDTPSKTFKITDDVDYLGVYGIALADVKGSLSITDPNNTTYHNTIPPAFDIHMSVQTYIDTILLPLDSNGNVMKGTYTFVYTVTVIGAVDPGTYVKTFQYNYQYDQVTPDVDITVDLVCSELTSTDNTPYQAELTNQTLTHTIHPPSGLNTTTYPVKTGSTKVLTYTPITTKTWTGKISNICEFTYLNSPNTFYVDDTIIGDSEKEIIDDVNICNMQCILRAAVERYKDSLATEPSNADKFYLNNLAPAMTYANMFTMNIQCGNFEKAEGYYQDALDILDAEPDCACSDSETPTLITPSCIGGSGNGITYVVDACGTNSAMTVTSNTVGSTTTYTVCFDNTLFNKLTALEQVVITSTGATVTVTSALVGYTRTWNLEVAGTLGTVNETFSGILDMDFTNKSALPTTVWQTNWDTLTGTKLQKPTINNSQALFANYQVNPNCFYLDAYVAAAGGEYPKPQFQIAEVLLTGQTTIDCSDLRSLRVAITNLDEINDRIYFQLVDDNYGGTGVPGNILTEQIDNIKISVTINA